MISTEALQYIINNGAPERDIKVGKLIELHVTHPSFSFQDIGLDEIFNKNFPYREVSKKLKFYVIGVFKVKDELIGKIKSTSSVTEAIQAIGLLKNLKDFYLLSLEMGPVVCKVMYNPKKRKGFFLSMTLKGK